jgi:hypothetical protein
MSSVWRKSTFECEINRRPDFTSYELPFVSSLAKQNQKIKTASLHFNSRLRSKDIRSKKQRRVHS